MTKVLIAGALAVGLLLAGCVDDRMRNLPPNTPLPPLPADLVQCLQRYGVDVPRRRLTVGEVERLWRHDRVTIVAMRQCGARIRGWYETLRRDWR